MYIRNIYLNYKRKVKVKRIEKIKIKNILCKMNKKLMQNNNNSENFKIHPNPANDILYIENFNFPKHKVNVIITDVLGNTLFQQTYEKQWLIPVQINNLERGVYFIEIEGKRDKFVILK